MAELKEPVLTFFDQIPCEDGADPGLRVVDLPPPLPEVGDDFDWDLRDYEGFRDFMLGELQARFPERQRWTSADMELVLIEILATALDHLSDMADRAVAESSLLTARRPRSVYHWLRLLGMDFDGQEPPWLAAGNRDRSHDMERDRKRGPSTIRQQRRMVSLTDYGEALSQHPLVFRVRARRQWQGSWSVVWAAVMLWQNIRLDDSLPPGMPEQLQNNVVAFHRGHGLYLDPDWQASSTPRDLLTGYVDSYRAVGQEVLLQDVVHVAINISLCVRIRPDYFQSEMRHEVMRALGRGPGGFFEPGRLTFGQGIPASDIFEQLMNLEGVDHVRLVAFYRVDQPGRQLVSTLPIEDHELAICDNDRRNPARGTIDRTLTGGRTG
ncbi:MAG: hypothetical protein MJE77_02205 [Proteobacteria bacterium]|nr:hypothetical protein [Pseudomonadota bacterium]